MIDEEDDEGWIAFRDRPPKWNTFVDVLTYTGQVIEKVYWTGLPRNEFLNNMKNEYWKYAQMTNALQFVRAQGLTNEKLRLIKFDASDEVTTSIDS